MANKTRVEISDEQLMEALSDYVTTNEATRLLGMYAQSVRNLIKAKRLKVIRVGRDWLIHRSSIDEYLKTKSPKGRPPRAKPKVERKFRT